MPNGSGLVSSGCHCLRLCSQNTSLFFAPWGWMWLVPSRRWLAETPLSGTTELRRTLCFASGETSSTPGCQSLAADCSMSQLRAGGRAKCPSDAKANAYLQLLHGSPGSAYIPMWSWRRNYWANILPFNRGRSPPTITNMRKFVSLLRFPLDHLHGPKSCPCMQTNGTTTTWAFAFNFALVACFWFQLCYDIGSKSPSPRAKWPFSASASLQQWTTNPDALSRNFTSG